MSKTTASIPLSCSCESFLFLPYKETMGNPVLMSLLLATFSLASAFPRKPCSGEKTFLTFIPVWRYKKSTKCTVISFEPVVYSFTAYFCLCCSTEV